MCKIAISCMYIVILFISVGIPVSIGQQSKCSNNKSLSPETSWNCVEIEHCEYANLTSAKKLVSCEANNTLTRSICCPEHLPKPDIPNPTQAEIDEANSVALKECHKYQGYRFHNYTKSGAVPSDGPVEISEFGCIQEIEHFIANGEEVREREYPFMALLSHDENATDDSGWICSGTLISRRFILTAASCTKLRGSMTVKWALLGELKRHQEITEELRQKNLFKVIKHINHPLYGVSDDGDNDIALLKLEKEIPLSISIRPICLYHDQTIVNVNSKVTIAGWGVEVAGERESEYLRKAVIEVLEDSTCVEKYKLDSALQNGFHNTTMICGGDLKDRRDACPGDAGGPMLVPINNYKCMFMQVGIVSRGTWECGENEPAIYTRISYYLPWIRSIVWRNA